MKKFLLAVAVLCVGTMALAGPNQFGTIFAHDSGLGMTATNGNLPICPQGVIPAHCTEADAEIDGAVIGNEGVFKVYAAFIEGSSPRLMGITWGVTYDNSNIVIPAGLFGNCGDFELNDTGWPGSGLGSSVTWNTVQTGYIVPVYWFAAYNYIGPGVFMLGPNPGQGGMFGDDTIPAQLDAIAGYGTIGFDMPGVPACPQLVELGACCDPATGACVQAPASQCLSPFVWHPEWQTCDPNPCPLPIVLGACCDPATGGCAVVEEAFCSPPSVWHPEWLSCEPNPCPPPPVPTEKSTWGQIKNNYR